MYLTFPREYNPSRLVGVFSLYKLQLNYFVNTLCTVSPNKHGNLKGVRGKNNKGYRDKKNCIRRSSLPTIFV